MTSPVIFDLETYPNTFTACFVESTTKKCVVYEISDRKDEREKLFIFLRKIYKSKRVLVGFNNLAFDYPILHFLLYNKKASVEDIYNKAMSLIKYDDDEQKFANLIPAKDVLIPQIDLFKIHHFDNRAKSTSLKVIEFNMRSDTIEDLPFPVGTMLNDEQKDLLIKYNKHDVMKTLEFYFESKGKIEFREKLKEKYGRDFTNHNDTKIGKDYFIMRLEEKNPEACYKRVGGRRLMQQTKRDKIELKDCIFPYVKFERPEFNAVLNWFKSQTIKETKGVFSNLREDQLGEVAQYAEMVEKKKKLFKQPTEAWLRKAKREHPMGYLKEEPLKSGKVSLWWCWKVAETLNVVVDGLRYDFGTGGIHASLRNKKIKSNDLVQVVDLDVSSYYPNLAIKNKIHPEHLGSLFCSIYEDMYNQRKVYDKKSDENATLKLALNGTYGDSNNQYSPFYDPMFTMKITINGQLSLCMLAEKLIENKGFNVIQCNTDGLTVMCPRSDDSKLVEIYKDWEKRTKLELERADYSEMYIADVNSYIALGTTGKVKRKGRYEYENLGHHQNQSMLVIPKAAEHFLLGKGTIESFIRNHQDKYDFMARLKAPRSNRVVSVDDFGVESSEQNICRYYVSNEGVDLIKIMPPLSGGKTVKVWEDKKGKEIETDTDARHKALQERLEKGLVRYIREYYKPNEERRQAVEAGYKVTVCNNIEEYRGDINFDYYIKEANKLVESLEEYTFNT